MKTQNKINRYLHISGVVILLAGALDPMEGSVSVVVGSLLLTIATFRKADSHWKLFLASFIMITVGVVLLFYLSSLGGFGGNSNLSRWWGLLILPYPLGWLMDVVLLIARAYQKKNELARS